MNRTLALTLPALLLSACVTTATSSRTWGEPYGQGWTRYGRVESVRETVHRQQGDPAGGAVAGAIIGGLLGNAFSGGHGGATVAGAVGGAMVGASASQGAAEQRTYEVFVRFDDGAVEQFVYQNVLPFRVGEPVVLTANGLDRAQAQQQQQYAPQQYPPEQYPPQYAPQQYPPYPPQ
jgi:outer membrane lipoprotein SlyB